MRISVALCTSDDAGTLAAFLESLRAQTVRPDELVIRDDRSVDATVDIARAFDAPFPVRIAVNERRLGSGVNHGVVLNDCTGDVTAIASASHTWVPTRLERAVAPFDSDAVMGAVFCNGTTGDTTLWDVAEFNAARRQAATDGKLLLLLLAYPFITAATGVIRTDLREILTPVPEHVSFDWWLTTLSLMVRSYTLLDEPLLRAEHADVAAPTGVIPDEDPTARRIPHHLRALGEKVSVRHSDLHRQARRAQAAFYQAVVDRFMNGVSPYLDLHGLPSQELAGIAVHEMRERVTHFRLRGGLPDQRIKRVGRVVQEVRSGRYTRYSSGILSALQDLTY